MKTIFIVLATVALAAAAQEKPDPFASRSISSSAVDALEGMKEQMPCGYPELGIPPLAPLNILHHAVNIDTEALQLSGTVNNLLLHGLNDFEIAEMKINAITSKVVFRFIFNNINVDTEYDLKLRLKKAGFTVDMVGAGHANVAIKDFTMSVIAKYSLGILSGKMKLKSLDVRLHCGAVKSDIKGIMGEGDINHKMNKFLEEAVTMAINENEDMIAQTIEEMAVPRVNSVLEEYKISDLIGSIGGGGDGEKIECIPSSK